MLRDLDDMTYFYISRKFLCISGMAKTTNYKFGDKIDFRASMPLIYIRISTK